MSSQEDEALRLLSEHDEFRHVEREHLVEFAQNGLRRTFAAGDVLMVQGEPSDCMHLMVKGRVEVQRNSDSGTRQLAELVPGDIVGEMGVLHGDPRSATVTALEPVQTLELRADFLHDIFGRAPVVLYAIATVINERIKDVDDIVENTLKMALANLEVDSPRAEG